MKENDKKRIKINKLSLFLEIKIQIKKKSQITRSRGS